MNTPMNQNEKPVTMYEALTTTHKILCNITVPAAYIESIGIPVSTSIKNIEACLDAIRRDAQERANAAAEQPATLEPVEQLPDDVQEDQVIELNADESNN